MGGTATRGNLSQNSAFYITFFLLVPSCYRQETVHRPGYRLMRGEHPSVVYLPLNSESLSRVGLRNANSSSLSLFREFLVISANSRPVNGVAMLVDGDGEGCGSIWSL